MKNRGFFAGLLCGALVFGGTTAYAAGVMAELSTQPIYVDGQQVSMSAYNIGGNNYSAVQGQQNNVPTAGNTRSGKRPVKKSLSFNST